MSKKKVATEAAVTESYTVFSVGTPRKSAPTVKVC